MEQNKSTAKRPEHGLDQQSLVSDPNVNMHLSTQNIRMAAATSEIFRFGVQPTVFSGNQAFTVNQINSPMDRTLDAFRLHAQEEQLYVTGGGHVIELAPVQDNSSFNLSDPFDQVGHLLGIFRVEECGETSSARTLKRRRSN